jgi:PAS domain S-box-containing protein
LAIDTAQKLLDLAPDALILVNAAGSVVYANSAVETMFGISPDELLGRDIDLLLPERLRAIHMRHRVVFGTNPSTREMSQRALPLFARRRDGSEFPVEIRLSPIELPEGVHIMAAIRDATERRRLSDQLAVARERADTANHAKSRFLATASHDLRQPLQTLQLLQAAMTRQPGIAPFAPLLDRQQQALTAMTDLLNALLDVSKLESGTIQVNREKVPLQPLLADLRQQFESVAAQRNLQLLVSVPSEVLWTDRVLLRQLLQNLIANALRYTNSGTVTVRGNRSAAGLTLEVEDTGVGIPADKLERIFDEYYQIDHNSGGTKGFGLGLTIVKYISRVLEFPVAVRSQPGTGTCFGIDIPAKAMISGEGTSETRLAPRSPPDGARKPSILVIEDDDAVRSAIELALSLEGYPTRVAESAAAAERVFGEAAADIDLVVSDFHLEGSRTGKDVVEALRAIAGRDLPAVFLTGDTSSVVRKVEGVPRSMLLSKPADFAKLVAALEDLFGAESEGTPG